MPVPTCPHVVVPRSDESRPQRLWRTLAQAAKAWWLADAERRVSAYRFDALDLVSARTLADLGLPDAALAWAELQRQRRDDLPLPPRRSA